ncbi:MAG TPA: acyltransferase [Rhizomicrobium sp.]|nr:acyltransferase [Rhizomicrobium sp.]
MDAAVRTESPVRADDTYSVPVGYLRAVITFLVVVHHSLIAYVGAPASHQFAGGAMLWRAFPVVDSAHWAPSGTIVGINDVFFMSLMFLISGLFVSHSVARKGRAAYLRDRIVRLGVPFLFCALVIVPAAYYFAYLQSGDAPGLENYWHAWRQIGYWPTGPAWFISLLLAFDIVAGALFLIVPSWPTRIGRLTANAGEHPWRFFGLLLVASAIAYLPLAIAFGPSIWTYWGFFQFQTARPLHYFIYFVIGAGLGAFGLHAGLLSPEGRLAKRWWLWVLAAFGSLVVGTGILIGALTAKGPAQQIWIDVGDVTFVLSCGTLCFALLAIFLRFVKRANRVMDSLSRNAYGIYVVHYAFVAAVQYALLTQPLPGAAKAGIAIAGALAASWITTAVLRRIPLVSYLVGR